MREVPLLFVPPTINKYYVLDLAPGPQPGRVPRQQGQQVFVISWRNPDDEQGHFDLDTYAAAVLEARDAVAEHHRPGRRPPQRRLLGRASSPPARSAHLAAEGRLGEVASLTLMVCALDNERAGTASALASRELAAAAVAESARRGYLDGQALAGVFTWLRPNDLIWNYVVNNYLLGKHAARVRRPLLEPGHGPPAAGLHRDFVRLGARQRADASRARSRCSARRSTSAQSTSTATSSPGSTTTSSRGRTPTASTQLLGGDTRFVLSTSGHIQALVNPPAPDSRASYRDRRPAPGRPEARPAQLRQLVARLRRLAGRALRAHLGAAAGSRSSSAGAKAPGDLRPCPTEALPIRQHLGDALATDYFRVREQFTDEQWEHFLATRRFVDEEVLPGIDDYWEARRAAVAADAPARPSSGSSARTSRATAARA